ncbi:MAG: group II intron reverse transcriptase domain-containing protein [Magnetococcales bacterium]|nr:group II intron reverse transcriptase domain-containing protein [Magnetococcales bacterium]
MKFEQNLEENLLTLREDLISHRYAPGSSQAFLVEKPKRREVFAAPFRDRVVHHVLVDRLESTWEARFIHDSHACRKGHGTHTGVNRLRQFTRQVTGNGTSPSWYLQLDIRGFFMAIDRKILFEFLAAHIKNLDLFWLTHTMVFYDPVAGCRLRGAELEEFLALPAHKTLFHARPGCGFPIGNLTSQFFANVYLDKLDQFVKHELKAQFYVRYCDDFVLLSPSRDKLEHWKGEIEGFLADRLRLELNERSRLRPVTDGIDFLGYIVRPAYMLVRRRVVVSLREKMDWVERELRRRGMNMLDGRSIYPWPWPLLEKVRQWLISYHAHFQHASGYGEWKRIWERFHWLGEYLVWNGETALSKYQAPRYSRGIGQQRRWFAASLPDHLLVMQRGSRWNVVMRHRDTKFVRGYEPHGHVMSFRSLTEAKKTLWNQHRPVAWVAENGRGVSPVMDRVMIARWSAKMDGVGRQPNRPSFSVVP